MDLNKLKIFHSVAKFGRISEAASELKVNQSSISLIISSMEKELEKKLFTRHYKGMRLTVDGEKLYNDTFKLVSELYSAISGFKNKQGSVSGLITIATSYGISTSKWFTKRVTLFLKDHPQVKLRIVEYKSGSFDDVVADVFICPYINSLVGYNQELIKRFSFGLFASHSYIQEFGLPQNYEELDQHRLIAFTKELRNPFSDADSLLHIGREKHNPRSISLEVSNSRSILEFVKEGVGIAIIDKDECVDFNFVSIFDSNNEFTTESFFVYKKNIKECCNITSLKSYLSQEDSLI